MFFMSFKKLEGRILLSLKHDRTLPFAFEKNLFKISHFNSIRKTAQVRIICDGEDRQIISSFDCNTSTRTWEHKVGNVINTIDSVIWVASNIKGLKPSESIMQIKMFFSSCSFNKCTNCYYTAGQRKTQVPLRFSGWTQICPGPSCSKPD